MSEFMSLWILYRDYKYTNPTHALMGGMYSGFADMSKVPKEQFNFMRELHE